MDPPLHDTKKTFHKIKSASVAVKMIQEAGGKENGVFERKIIQAAQVLTA